MISESLKIKILIIISLMALWTTYFFTSPPVITTETIKQNYNEETNDQKKNTKDDIQIKPSILNKNKCLELVNLGNKYYDGNGKGTTAGTGDTIVKNLNKAKEYFIEACEGSCGKGCDKIGIMYYKGEGLDIDYFKAKDFFVKACYFKYSCTNLGVLYQKGLITKYPDYVNAMYNYKKSCRLNNGHGCYMVGNLYTYGPGPMIARDLNQTYIYYKKSCDLEYEKGCEALKELTK